MSKITVDIVRNLDELNDAFAIRRQEFVQKQNVPENTEFDGNDFSATQILAKVDGKPAATLRIRYFHDFVRFERMCVLPEYRKMNVPEKILAFVSDLMQKKGFTQAHCFCKEELVPYWESKNHKRIPGAKGVQVKNMTLAAISYDFPKGKAVQINADPSYLLAPEGKWPKEEEMTSALSQTLAKAQAR